MSVPFSCSKYFLPACSFSFSYPSLSQSKSFRFIEVLSNNFSFYGSCFGVMSKNSLLTPRLLEFSPLCPSLFYQIYDPFSVNFFIRYKVEVWGSFFWIWMSICSDIVCWKDCPFSVELHLHLCQNLLSILWGSVSGLCSGGLWVYPFARTTSCDYYDFILKVLKLGNDIPPPLIFFLKIVLTIIVSLPFHVNFSIILHILKNPAGIFI